jgi:hypothetical protein
MLSLLSSGADECPDHPLSFARLPARPDPGEGLRKKKKFVFFCLQLSAHEFSRL